MQNKRFHYLFRVTEAQDKTRKVYDDKFDIRDFDEQIDEKSFRLHILRLRQKSQAKDLTTIENEMAKIDEGKEILSKIKDEYVISLDIKGEMLDSISFSKKIEDINTTKSSKITFVIGGSLGLSDEVLKRSDYRLSFSPMTFPHQLFKLILLEQIYRAYKIQTHEIYHK